MNCRNCGAPMRLVRHRDFWACDHCTSFHFPAPSGDGVRLLGGRSDRNCPACQGALLVASVEGHRVEACARCEGVLFPLAAFGRAVQARRAAHDGPRLPAPPVDPDELKAHRPCPRCLAKMETHPYLGGGGVVIDSCFPCELVWLDRGELAQLARCA